MLVNLWGHFSYFVRDFSMYFALLFITTVAAIIFVYKIYKSEASPKKKKVFLLLVFAIFSLVLIYSGFEAYFRYSYDESDSLGFLNITDRWFARHVTANNYQYRDRNFNMVKTAGRIRIVVLGDSLAFGYGIKNVHDRFSNILEQKLNKNGYNVEVYNFGVSGVDTWNEIIYYQTSIKKFDPDIVVWEYYLNDAEPKNSAGNKVLEQTNKQIPLVVKTLSSYSFFFDYLYWKLSPTYKNVFLKLRDADLNQYYIPSVYEQHVQNVKILMDDIKGENSKTKVVVLIFPFLRFFPNYPQKAIDVHVKMKNLFLSDGAQSVIDLYSSLKGKNPLNLIINKFDTHPNEYVNNIAAEQLYNVIVPLLEKNGSVTNLKQ